MVVVACVYACVCVCVCVVVVVVVGGGFVIISGLFVVYLTDTYLLFFLNMFCSEKCHADKQQNQAEASSS